MKRKTKTKTPAAKPFAAATGSVSRRRETASHILEPVTITLTRKQWRLIARYLSGDVETMTDPDDRSAAQSALTWIQIREEDGNRTRQGTRLPPNTKGQP